MESEEEKALPLPVKNKSKQFADTANGTHDNDEGDVSTPLVSSSFRSPRGIIDYNDASVVSALSTSSKRSRKMIVRKPWKWVESVGEDRKNVNLAPKTSSLNSGIMEIEDC